jgi:hypothetical protein
MDPITDNGYQPQYQYDYNGYQPQYQYDYWTSLEMSNVPSEQLDIEVMADEWEMDLFLQFIGTMHI